MRVEVNGEPREVEAGTTVLALVEALVGDSRAVAVERNGDVLPRARLAETRLEEGDRLEVVRFVQGGAPGDERV
jgi:thiamine biosynthesis protein ThiS